MIAKEINNAFKFVVDNDKFIKEHYTVTWADDANGQYAALIDMRGHCVFHLKLNDAGAPKDGLALHVGVDDPANEIVIPLAHFVNLPQALKDIGAVK